MIALKKDQLTRIGFINKAIGFKGMISCITDITHPEKLFKAKFLFIIHEGLPVPYEIEELEIAGNELRIKFLEIDSEKSAKKIQRAEVFAEKIKENKRNQILSWKDLAGYNVIDEVHGELGIIEEVLEYPQQMIARCTVNGKEALFPLNENIVVEIIEEEKTIHVELPEGLLDVYL